MRRLVFASLLLAGCWDFSSLAGLHGTQTDDAGIGGGGGGDSDAATGGADDGSSTDDASMPPDDAAPDDGALGTDLFFPDDARPPADLAGLPTAFTSQSSPTSTALNGVWGSSANDVYIVGGSGAGVILHSTGNKSWSTQLSSGGGLEGVWGSSASDIYAVGEGGTILHSTGNGSWSLQSSGTTATLRGVWGPSANEVYVVGTGIILRSTGNGVWTTDWTDGDAMLLDVTGAPGHVWAVGSSSTATSLNGLIVHRQNGAWTQQLTQPNEIMQAAWATQGDAVLVGGATLSSQTRILRGGAAGWTVVTTSAAGNQTLFGVWGSGWGDVYAVGHQGEIVRCIGSTWTALGGQPSTDLFRVWGSSPSDVYAVGENGVILHLP
jgi:hypothetical protein